MLRYLLHFIIGVALVTMTGCEKPQVPLRVGTNIWIGYEPLYLAETKGYYEGSSIRLVAMQNATEVLQAMRAGMLEAAALTLDEALTLRQDGKGIKVVLVMDTSNGADVLMVRPEIKTLRHLKGKRVGVENTAVGAIMLNGALDAAGLSLTDIQLVPLTIDKHEYAYANGDVDALITFEPVLTKLKMTGAHILFDSSRIPDRVVDVLVVTTEAAMQHGQEIRRLVAGHFQSLDYLRRAPLEAAGTMVARQGISAQEIIESYKGLHIPDLAINRRYLTPGQSSLEKNAQQLANLMLENGLLEHSVSVQNLFDARFLPDQ